MHIHFFWHDAPDRQVKEDRLLRRLCFDGALPQFTLCRTFQKSATPNKGPRQRAFEKVIKKSRFYSLGPKLGKVWSASGQDLDLVQREPTVGD